MRRRPPSVLTLDPAPLEAFLSALPSDSAAALRDAALTRRALAGDPIRRAELAQLRKRLLRASLSGWIDHRSGAYAAAKNAAARATVAIPYAVR